MTSIAIDCLGKLFSYNFWGRHEYQGGGAEGDDEEGNNNISSNGAAAAASAANDEDRANSMENEGGGGIMALVIDTICESFAGGENTDEKVQVQIVKVNDLN